MFLDTTEPRAENENSRVVETVLILWAQICWKKAQIVHKMALKKKKLD